MANCRYCGQKAGWFNDAHDACLQKAEHALKAITKTACDAVTAGRTFDQIKSSIETTVCGAHVPQSEVLNAIRAGWSRGTVERSKAQPISAVDFAAIEDFWTASGLTSDDIYFKTAGHWAMCYSYRLWTVLHDKVVPYQGPVRFNLQAKEVPVWGISNVLLNQQCTTTAYVGDYGGASVRVANGLYYHFGGLRGHRVESTSLQEVDFGDFLLTTRAIYFGGEATGVNFRLPYNQVIRIQPYSDAVGICRNGAREQIFVPLGAATSAGLALANSADTSRIPNPKGQPIIPFPDCGWFLFNLLHALSARDSVTQSNESRVRLIQEA